jgi:hypothetical protein
MTRLTRRAAVERVVAAFLCMRHILPPHANVEMGLAKHLLDCLVRLES